MTRVLVVDDERSVRDAFAFVLRTAGHEVETAGDVDAALRILAERPADVVVSDIVLPGRSGIELLDAVSQSGSTARVILVTGEPRLETASLAVRGGAHDYLTKPVSVASLTQSVERAAHVKGLQDENARLAAEVVRHRAELERLVRRRTAQVRGARRALDATQARLRRIARNIPGVLFEIAIHPDGELEFAYLGENLRAILDVRRADALRTPRALLDIVDPADREAMIASLRAAAEARQPWTWEGRGSTPEGGVRWLQAVARPTTRNDGTILFDGAIFDVTAQRELEGRLAHADRMAAIGTLAAGIAHEINNPLTYVLGNLDLLTEHMRGEGHPDVDLVAEAHEGVERVREIVGDLRSFSHVPEEAVSPVDLRTVLESAIRLAQVDLRHRARISREYHAAPVVMANPSRLGQVFVNLLVNAAQAMSEGTPDEHEVRIGLDVAGDMAVVALSDTGCGIAEDALPRLFDPFYTTKPNGVGTGLGLYVSQAIVLAHGGRIEVESQAGRGSTFRVLLPSLGEGARPEPRARAATLDDPPAARILVIDDEALVANTVRRVLRAHDVTVALSGQEGIDALRCGGFDAVICDLIMPRITGMDVFDWVARERPEMARRMIFMTGGAFSERARAFLAEVENPTIDKPFDLSRLRQVVAEVAAARG